eukprot:1816632-Pleurochrysis_carterae.AAC.1
MRERSVYRTSVRRASGDAPIHVCMQERGAVHLLDCQLVRMRALHLVPRSICVPSFTLSSCAAHRLTRRCQNG